MRKEQDVDKAQDKAFLVKLARKARDKRWSFDALKYGDDLYGQEHLAHEVWSLVEELDEIGRAAFDAKYGDNNQSVRS